MNVEGADNICMWLMTCSSRNVQHRTFKTVGPHIPPYFFTFPFRSVFAIFTPEGKIFFAGGREGIKLEKIGLRWLNNRNLCLSKWEMFR